MGYHQDEAALLAKSHYGKEIMYTGETEKDNRGVATLVADLTHNMEIISNLGIQINQLLGGRMSAPQVDNSTGKTNGGGVANLPEQLSALFNRSQGIVTNLEEANNILRA